MPVLKGKHMTKARIIVDGTVQGTGYRALVKSYANRRGLTGLARNLPDGKVEIFCEGTKGKIEQLTKDINVKGSPSNPLSLNVEKIDVAWEGDKNFTEAWKTYTGFEIDYGAEKLTAFEKENLESLEWAKLHFTMMETSLTSSREESNKNFKVSREESSQNSKALNGSINSFRAEANQNSKALENGIITFRDNTQESFTVMANKYDAISTDVKSTKQELTTSLDKLPDRIGEALTKHLKKLMK